VAATGTNTIDNTTYTQTWNWNGLGTGTALAVNANSNTSTNGILTISNTTTSGTGIVFKAQSNSTANTGLYVLANGYVGIGDSTPNNTLEITSTSTGLSGLRFTNLTSASATSTASGRVLSVNSNGDVILVDDASAAAGAGVNTLGVPTGSNALGGTIAGSTLTFTFADATNPGIVSTTTQTFAGAKTFSSAPTFSTMTPGSLLFAGTGGLVSQNNPQLFWNNSTNALGIGTTTPDYPLTISTTGVTGLRMYKNNNTSDATDAFLSLEQAGTGDVSMDYVLSDVVRWRMGIDNSDGDKLKISSGASYATGVKFTLDTNGNIGIGTSTPGALLHLSTSTANLTNIFMVSGTSSRSLLRVQQDVTDPLDVERVIIGQGGIAAAKPDSMARDQLYVFGRINSSWDYAGYDFMNGRTALSADGDLGGNLWFDEVSASTATFTSVAGYSGILRVAIATAAANVSDWVGSGGVQVTQRSLNPVFEARIQGDANVDHRMIAGFHRVAVNTAISADTNNSTDEIFFRKTAAGTNWTAVTRNGSGTENVTDLTSQCGGACTTNTMRILRIEVQDVGTNGTVYFFIDGTLVATHNTAAVPAAATRLAWGVGQAVSSTVARSYDADFIKVWSDDPADSIENKSINLPAFKEEEPVVFTAASKLPSFVGSTKQFIADYQFIFANMATGSIDRLSTFADAIEDNDMTIQKYGEQFVNLIKSSLEKLSDIFININLWVKSIKADKVETKELCIEDVCVTKEQLRTLLQNSNQSYTPPAVNTPPVDNIPPESQPEDETLTDATSTEIINENPEENPIVDSPIPPVSIEETIPDNPPVVESIVAEPTQ
jgi:hypothetical protein